MERGQEGRPAHGTDETVEAIELVGAQADGDAHDEPIEDGASTEGPMPQHVPGGGPPAHWLAYIRARAPWLLSAGGLIGEVAEGSSPDVVPHGPGAHLAPWPPAEPASSAAGAAMTQAPAFGAAVVRPAGGDGPEPLTGVPDVAASHASGDRPPALDDPSGRRDSVDEPLRDVVQEAAGPAPSLEPAGPDAAREAPRHARPPETWADEPGDDAVRAATAAALARIPSPDPVSPPPPIAWPAFSRSDDEGTRPHRGEPWPPPVAHAPRTLSPMSEPGRPVTEHAPAAFDPVPARIRPDTTPFDLGGWHVRAAAPDTSMVARLALPPWPDLPEPPPDDDDPDWRVIERRLQRAARLDREQRRR